MRITAPLIADCLFSLWRLVLIDLFLMMQSYDHIDPKTKQLKA